MRDLAGLALRLLGLQRVDKFDRRLEAHPLAMTLDRLDAKGGGQVSFARARAADEDDVVRRVGELRRVERTSASSTWASSNSKPPRSR